MSDTLIERPCAGCGKDISHKRPQALTCSGACRQAKHEGRDRHPDAKRECEVCKEDISDKQPTARFCSHNCIQKRNYCNNRFNVWNYLFEHPCVECGEDDPILLEFDHLDPKKKKKQIPAMLHYSWPTIAKEIAKCQVLCVKCHRLRTAEQQGWYSDRDWKMEFIVRHFAPQGAYIFVPQTWRRAA